MPGILSAVHICTYVFVSRCPATKTLKANFRLQERCGLLKSGPVMREVEWLTKLLFKWGAFDHVSHAPNQAVRIRILPTGHYEGPGQLCRMQNRTAT